jgi:hypothetical protein
MRKSSLVAALAVAGALSSQAALFNFSATLSGAEEVPANNSPASGFVSATYDSVSGQFSLGGVFGGLTTIATAAHVHAGAVGVNGPVILPLTILPGGSTSGALIGVFAAPLTPNQVNGLFAENWYVNVHTSSFPGGEIRGQLQLTAVPEPETYAAMAGVALVGFGIWRRQRR